MGENLGGGRNAKKTFITIGIVVLFIIGVYFGAYKRGAADAGNNSRAENRTAETGRVLQEYRRRQREDNERLGRIYQRTTEIRSAVRELRESDRRSGDLYEQLEQEVDILEDYLASNERELAGYRGDSGAGDKAVEVSD